jgi:hypothetical protein
MKKKILGMLVCVLLIASAIPTVGSLRNSLINGKVPSAPLTSIAANWTEMQKLLASDGTAVDAFGWSVSLSGDTALIGAIGDADNGLGAGSAYVFTRTGSTWTQQAKLLPPDGGQGYWFGDSVSLSGDTALIGEPYDAQQGCNSGSAYVFTRTGTTWMQQAKILSSDGAGGDNFGCSVSLDGDTALIGAPGDNDNGDISGSAYIFTRTGTTWTQQTKILASDGASYSKFGCSVSLNLDTALIGAYWGDGNEVDSGSSYVFIRTGTTWIQQAKLLASDGAADDLFGYSVSLDKDTALIGAYADDDNDASSGSAYVFIRTGTTWAQQQKILALDGATFDFFGYSVALSDNTAFIGATQNIGNGYYSGSMYVFIRPRNTWMQQAKLLASDGAAGDCFGCSVSLNSNTALIGAFWDDDNGDDSGSVYVFKDINGNQLPLADFSWTPLNSSPNQQITFNASASHDPDGTITLFEWDWNNDGVFEESHSSPATTHSWATAGSYSVTLRVTDDDDATSTITKTVNVSEINLAIGLYGGIGVNADIKNSGTTVNVTWQLEVKGSILGLIHKSASGVLVVQGGESRWVSTGPFLGIGPFTVVAKVNEVEKTAKGIVLLFYVIILT